MAQSNTTVHRQATKRRRPGVHAKTKTSNHKQSRNYKKRSVGQGK